MLYEHRKTFFEEKIGSWNDDKWFTDGSDDSHYFYTAPYHITKN